MHSQHFFNKKDLFYFSQNVKICNIDSALAHERGSERRRSERRQAKISERRNGLFS